MTYDDYQKLGRHKLPYTFTIQSGSSFLYYFGEKHSFNPDDVQWAELKEFWSSFLDKTKDQKRVVFIEGNMPPLEETETESVLKHGGRGLVKYLASLDGVETHCPEPGEKVERDELEKQFTRKQIQYYYFAGVVYQWTQNHDPKPDFVEYMKIYEKLDQEVSGWTDFDFSLEGMKKVHAEFFDTPFDHTDSRFFYDIVNPVSIKTFFNTISRISTEIRDTYIVKEIEKYMKEGYSVFIEFGASHAVIQEPLLREIL